MSKKLMPGTCWPYSERTCIQPDQLMINIDSYHLLVYLFISFRFQTHHSGTYFVCSVQFRQVKMSSICNKSATVWMICSPCLKRCGYLSVASAREYAISPRQSPKGSEQRRWIFTFLTILTCTVWIHLWTDCAFCFWCNILLTTCFFKKFYAIKKGLTIHSMLIMLHHTSVLFLEIFFIFKLYKHVTKHFYY